MEEECNFPTLRNEPLKSLPILGLTLSTKRKRINSNIKNINFVVKAGQRIVVDFMC